MRRLLLPTGMHHIYTTHAVSLVGGGGGGGGGKRAAGELEGGGGKRAAGELGRFAGVEVHIWYAVYTMQPWSSRHPLNFSSDKRYSESQVRL